MAKVLSLSSFWESVSDSRLLCQPECTDGCNGDNEENEAFDDFQTARMTWDDLPVANLPHAFGRHEPDMESVDDDQASMDAVLVCGRIPRTQGASSTLAEELARSKNQFSLPWADLNGHHEDSLLTPVQERNRPITHLSAVGESPLRQRKAPQDAARHLLLFSNSSTGSSFTGLPKPKFLSGIPTKAYLYNPDPTDPIDVEMARVLRVTSALNPEAGKALALRCVEPGAGRYEIDGRDILIYWDGKGTYRRLLVHEDEVGGATDMPLQDYLNVVAHIRLDLQSSQPPSAPVVSLLTFVASGAPKTADSMGDEERCDAMRMACTQARIREEEAERQFYTGFAGGLNMHRAALPMHH